MSGLPASSDAVHTVLVVSKSHLDIGFTDLAAEVRRRWLREHLPAAMATAKELREQGGQERLCWTTKRNCSLESFHGIHP